MPCKLTQSIEELFLKCKFFLLLKSEFYVYYINQHGKMLIFNNYSILTEKLIASKLK